MRSPQIVLKIPAKFTITQLPHGIRHTIRVDWRDSDTQLAISITVIEYVTSSYFTFQQYYWKLFYTTTLQRLLNLFYIMLSIPLKYIKYMKLFGTNFISLCLRRRFLTAHNTNAPPEVHRFMRSLTAL